jgi:hypothetical protein
MDFSKILALAELLAISALKNQRKYCQNIYDDYSLPLCLLLILQQDAIWPPPLPPFHMICN